MQNNQSQVQSQNAPRQYYLDWLRVMVILTVFVYHSTRFFNLGDWHVKSATTYWNVELFQQVIATWMMPLCFVVSGASVFYALGHSSAGKFIKDKVLRLFVPLAVGSLTHISFQVYLERLSHGAFSGSFLDFIPHYFEGMYALGGNFAWMGLHLWYLEMLFVFSLLLLPVFWFLTHGWGRRLMNGLGRVLSVPGVVFIFLLIPAVWIVGSIPEDDILGMMGWGGWGIMSHLWYFISGFVIVSSERVQASIRRLRWVWLVGAIGLTAAQIGYAIENYQGVPFGLKQMEPMAYLWILAFLGLARAYLNFNRPSLQRANEAVLPFYIMHQTVLIVLGYWVLQWAIPDAAKWAVIAAGSFATIILLYESLVRRYNLLRFLFGLKLLPPATVETREAGLAQKLA